MTSLFVPDEIFGVSKIINDESLKTLRGEESASFDLVITSPPNDF